MNTPHFSYYCFKDGVPILAGGLIGSNLADPLEHLHTYKFFEYLRIKEIQCDFIRLLDHVNSADRHLQHNMYEDLEARIEFLEVTLDEYPEPLTAGENAKWVFGEVELLIYELDAEPQAFRENDTVPDIASLRARVMRLWSNLTFIDT